MKLSASIIRMLTEKAGYPLTSPAAADRLRYEMEKKTGELLGRNTICRLLGLQYYTGKPSKFTLDVIANYLGYGLWDNMQGKRPARNEGFYSDSDLFLDMGAFEEGTYVEVAWDSECRLKMKHIGEGRYKTVRSENCPLQPGDILTVKQLVYGYPLLANNVERDRRLIGNYFSAGHGITDIKVE